MNPSEFIAAESDRFASVLASLDPATPVPSCPEWTARDLIKHLTQVHHFWATILNDDLRTDPDVQRLEETRPELPESIDEILPVRAAATRALAAALDNLDDAEPRWSWWPREHTVGFTRKMQICEAVMHRVDAELTAGLTPTPLSEHVAAHCLSHCVDVMWAVPDGADHHSRGIAEITAGRREWLVDVGEWRSDDGQAIPRAERAPARARPTITVTGELDDLARWAWGRGGQVHITGDAGGIEAVERLIAAGIQ